MLLLLDVVVRGCYAAIMNLPPGTYSARKIDDPEFIEYAELLKKQAEEAMDSEPERVQEIVEQYKVGMAKLLEWYEHEREEWVTTDVSEERLREEGLTTP